MAQKKEKNKLPETFDVLKNIAELRKERGLSQENIAESMGIKQAGYSLIESGDRILTVDRLYQVAKALGVSATKILDPSYDKNIAIRNNDPVEAILQIKLQSDKKNQVLSLVLGENCLEILNK